MIIKIRLTYFFGIIALLFGTSCVKTERDPVRIGINAWPTYEFLYLAEKKGFFEEEGVFVDIVEFSSLADGRRAYERGQLDGLACTLVEHLQILDRSFREPKICLATDYSDGSDVVLAKSGIRELNMLKGKKLGLEIDSLGDFMLARMLDKSELNLDDLEIMPMDQMSLEKSFIDGLIDAAISYPPYSGSMIEKGDGRVIFSSSELLREILGVLILESDFVENRPEETDAIVRAYFRAQKWAEENPQEGYEIMGKRQGMTGEEFKASLSDGLRVLTEGDQKEYFDRGGMLQITLKICEQVLEDAGQINWKTDSSDSIRYSSPNRVL